MNQPNPITLTVDRDMIDALICAESALRGNGTSGQMPVTPKARLADRMRDAREVFLMDINRNHLLWDRNPAGSVPPAEGGRGRPPTQRVAEPLAVRRSAEAWTAERFAGACRLITLRESTHGTRGTHVPRWPWTGHTATSARTNRAVSGQRDNQGAPGRAWGIAGNFQHEII